ncbi:MAG: hypothetical protein H0W70_04545 [Actinobacteria bacterium]|nr:hypothetical protein [Actinomycetota bacterium]
MARQRTTFGKLQRATEKRERAQAKQEKRAARAEQSGDDPSGPEPAADQEAVLQAFADLHTAYEDGRIPHDEFESRKALLTSQMRID